MALILISKQSILQQTQIIEAALIEKSSGEVTL